MKKKDQPSKKEQLTKEEKRLVELGGIFGELTKLGLEKDGKPESKPEGTAKPT